MNEGQIIYNGTSSAGKTSIAKELRHVMKEPYLYTGIDLFLIPGMVRAQFDLVHAHGLYDLEVDTACASAHDCALQIKARLAEGVPPRAFSRLKCLFASP